MTILKVVDVETTGLPPDAAVCELGWSDMHVAENAPVAISEPQSTLINPGCPIPPVASAVHHITDADVADAPMLDDALVRAGFTFPDLVFVAHKATFEQHFLPRLAARPWICTWKVAIRLAPRAPAHTNQALRYWLKLALDPALAVPAHRAGPDAYVTAHLLARMLGKMSVEEMVELSAQPAVLPYLTFGKHAMRPLEEVDSGYLEWMTRQADMDPDAVHTAHHHLKLRAAA